ARAAAARLDAEQVVQQRDDEAVVQRALGVTNDEGDDREAPGFLVSEDADVRVFAPDVDGALDERLLARADRLGADRFLELEDEAGADRLDDRRRAALFAM